MQSDLRQVIARWEGLRVLVVGDVMLDRTTEVMVGGTNPEDAVVPLYRVREVVDRPGGAANAALNLAALGARVTLIGAGGGSERLGDIAAWPRCRIGAAGGPPRPPPRRAG